jgi:hypothetical protein
MRFAPTRTTAMIAVLIAGIVVAWIGFSSPSIPFGITIVLCFLIWIIGARLANTMITRSRLD